ncbi:putative UDP-glucose flavonoid 3-O-glucosyltransferase 3 [Vitis vinifera]|uniref:Glycosyltransferase n=1 Tax=Vitis vinifera TaxID=29760 RepID=A0A438J3Q3_VITVI|nr:putative UDP-glucose flavonoid 3-O-glucosyltransferase 3 [Vitis vinifera]
MKKVEFVFIPLPLIGHLVPTVELAKLLVDRDDRFSITLLIMKLPIGNSVKPLVRDAVHQLVQSGESGRLGGIVVDLTCTSMIDVANELGVPSTIRAWMSLSLVTRILSWWSQVFVNSVPARVLPAAAVDKEGGGSTVFLDRPRRFRETKGILVNTFTELESRAINSFGNGTTPPVYPVGPLLNLKHDQNRELDVIHWLDDQPPSSVVFLCFGSLGAFNKGQIMEIANGLENSGFRFVWTLRGPPPKDDIASSDYTDFDEVLPKGFLNRTFGVGKIIGWAPQTDILSHHAIGGFISHCGWNSILESIWYGVPIATWPMDAEQQLNAFQMVRELGIAIEIKLDNKKNVSDLVNAQEVESKIKSLMDNSSDIKRKGKEMREKCVQALMKGGSSNNYLQCLIEDMISNM